jgi:hypothetical protein
MKVVAKLNTTKEVDLNDSIGVSQLPLVIGTDELWVWDWEPREVVLAVQGYRLTGLTLTCCTKHSVHKSTSATAD